MVKWDVFKKWDSDLDITKYRSHLHSYYVQFFIYHLISKFLSGQKTWTDISPKMIYNGQ